MRRAGPTPQGIITINADFSTEDMSSRITINNNQFRKDNDGLDIYPFGNEKTNYTIIPGDLVLSYKGVKGSNTVTQKVNVFANLNGLILPIGSDVDDLHDILRFVGVSKIIYDVSNRKAEGLSVAISGVNSILLNTDVKRIFYPGELIYICFPKINSIPNQLPRFDSKPPNKIIPIIRPYERKTMSSVYSKIANILSNDKTGKNVDPTGKTSAMYQIASDYKKAILTDALRVVEILLRRGLVQMTAKGIADDSAIDSIPMNDNTKKQQLHQLGQKIGLIGNGGDLTLFKKNVQDDIVNSALWAFLPSDKKSKYNPSIVHTQKTSRSNTTNIRADQQYYTKQCSETIINREMAIDRYKSKQAERIIGKVLEPCSPENLNPKVDVLISPVTTI